MATTYSIVDGANSNWKIDQKEGGVLRAGSWYAKGSATLNAIDGVLKIEADNRTYVIPLDLLTAPIFTDLQNAFEQVSAIMNG